MEGYVYDVQVVVRGVGDADEDFLAALIKGLKEMGAADPAVVHYPKDNEIGMMFQMDEEVLGELLEPWRSRTAA